MSESIRSTVDAVKAREKFIAENLSGIPDVYTDAHLGLDPAQWPAEAQAIKTGATADLKQYREQNPEQPETKAPGKWDFIKFADERKPAKPDPLNKWSFVRMPAA